MFPHPYISSFIAFALSSTGLRSKEINLILSKLLAGSVLEY